MIKIFVRMFFLSVLLAACNGATATETAINLSITDGETTKTYTLADLQALEQKAVEDQGLKYLGVPLATLLRDAGFDLETVTTVTAVASDGFSADYGPDLIAQPDLILSYARAEAPLAVDEAPFRMVAPGQGGKLNPRMVVELRISLP